MPYLRSFCRSASSALLVCLLFGAEPPGSWAAEVGELYSVEIAVDLEADDPRLDGFQQAMSELLVRLTGRRDAASDPLLVELVDRAPEFVQRWGFVTQEQLVVAFDGRAVEGELTRLQQPVWGKDRPLTLVWVALDAGLGDRRLLTETEEAPTDDEDDPVAALAANVVREVAAAAQRRGLPLVFPLLDSEDLTLVTFADVWGGFNGRIRAASRRYEPDGILVGRVRVVGDSVTARWQYLGEDEQRERRTGVAEGVDWLADIYATQYAVTGRTALARLVVTGVLSFDDYARVMRHLEELSIIDAVTVDELRGDQLMVAFETRATGDVLERALSLGGIIGPVATPPPDPLEIPLRATARYFEVLR